MPRKKRSSKVKKEQPSSPEELDPKYRASHTGFHTNESAFLMLTESRNRAIKGTVISEGAEKPEGSGEYEYKFEIVEATGEGQSGSWVHRQVMTVNEKDLRFNLENTEPYGPGYTWAETPAEGKDIWVIKKTN